MNAWVIDQKSIPTLIRLVIIISFIYFMMFKGKKPQKTNIFFSCVLKSKNRFSIRQINYYGRKIKYRLTPLVLHDHNLKALSNNWMRHCSLNIPYVYCTIEKFSDVRKISFLSNNGLRPYFLLMGLTLLNLTRHKDFS